MKKILGLDLGTTSIGWAFVNEGENNDSSIIRLGVRVNPLSTEELNNFEKGKAFTGNAERTMKRSARRNLQRYKQRRENLISILKENNIISNDTILAEDDKGSTHSTYANRAKAVSEQISLESFAQLLLMINKKRGYKSSRKVNNEDEGKIIDGMGVAKRLYDEGFTPGQLCFQLLKEGVKALPDFYLSDLNSEFDKIWKNQSEYYPDIFTSDFKKEIQGKAQRATNAMFWNKFGFNTSENKGTREQKRLQAYEWRSKGINSQLSKEEAAFVIAEINNNLNNSSGYLGAISDRSKELYFNKETIGQYLYKQLQNNPHTKLKNQVFYRQDYLDEFDCIWEKQNTFHPSLTPILKNEIRDVIIFYQRKLKSQKGLVSICELENETVQLNNNGVKTSKLIGRKVAPKSSPLFQEFKIWQNLHSLRIKNKNTDTVHEFDLQAKELLFNELNLKGNLTKNAALNAVGYLPKDWELNYATLEGNRTNFSLYEAFFKMMELEGQEEINWVQMNPVEIKSIVSDFFEVHGINQNILFFNGELESKEFEKQASYQLWHLLYSYESDNSNSGNELLHSLLLKKFGFKKEFAQILATIPLQQDYGNLSAKALRKMFVFIKENNYSESCKAAGYNHLSFLTKEENANRILKEKLEILPKNSLRNPIVEKILNQLVNVVNAIITDPSLGKPDEIRIELARELKKNAKERAEATLSINQANTLHLSIVSILQKEFNITNPTRNDIIRYKLYEELKNNGYKTLYSDTYIPREKLFSKEFDIEHIIPKARLFDDSFSNKTIAPRQENINKKDETAFDFVSNTLGNDKLVDYLARIEMMHNFKEGGISKAKYKKLLLKGVNIGEGFIERDLRDSQYIAKKAKQILEEICRTVNTTTGSITSKLREDWDLINVMQELNFDKYKKLGLTELIQQKDGNTKERIVDWTKRNDHRHHAMDALTVAFTKRSHVQYLNNLNARSDKSGSIYGIEQKETYKDSDGKRRFKLPLNNFRAEAKKQLENILVSIKAKNKVVTKNKNKILSKKGDKIKIELTPRGQLHKETVYGKIKQYVTKDEKVGANFDETTIKLVADSKQRSALLKRLKENNNDPKKAFTAKNSLDKNPLFIDNDKTNPVPVKVKLVWFEDDYIIRKEINPDLKIEKVIDTGIRRILQARLDAFGGKAKEAFSNLEMNPIWLNEKSRIAIKRVAISGVKNAEALHQKKDNLGKTILDANGNALPVDFVSTGNNHHVAIYNDDKGVLQEKVMSFYEAVERVNQGLPVIDKLFNADLGWQFLFTMKQNEYFIFPNDTYSLKDIDLLDPKNYKLISPYLFRVQKISTKDYMFNHHFETSAVSGEILKNKKSLSEVTYRYIQTPSKLKNIIKVRINHIGQIVKVGEY